jgi:hypothetical protein
MQLLGQGVDPLVVECPVGQRQDARPDLHDDRVGGLDDLLAKRVEHG